MYRSEVEEYDTQGRISVFQTQVTRSGNQLLMYELYKMKYREDGILLSVKGTTGNSLGGSVGESETQYEIGLNNLPIRKVYKGNILNATIEHTSTFLYNEEKL